MRLEDRYREFELIFIWKSKLLKSCCERSEILDICWFKGVWHSPACHHLFIHTMIHGVIQPHILQVNMTSSPQLDEEDPLLCITCEDGYIYPCIHLLRHILWKQLDTEIPSTLWYQSQDIYLHGSHVLLCHQSNWDVAWHSSGGGSILNGKSTFPSSCSTSKTMNLVGQVWRRDSR